MNQLLRRLTARLVRERPASSPGLGLPCVVCGEPATGWAVADSDRNGTQVISGYAACAAHQAEAESIPDSKAG